MTNIAQLPEQVERLLWHTDLATLPGWQRGGLHLARFGYAIGRDLTQGYLTLQAMSLVYTTLLSLVPLLAVSFSVLKGFGVHNQIEPMLLNALAPLGDRAAEITNRIIGFVDNVRVGVLGSVGLAVLIYTVVSLIQKIEQAFNYTWRVEQPRPFTQRFSQYLSVLLIGPVLFFSAVGVTASIAGTSIVQDLASVEPFGTLLHYLSRLVPYLMISIAFAFVYLFVPNTRVRVVSALIGALVAGVLWQGAGWLFATFMVSSTRYAAIYSGLAILILFMIWVYVAWLILLIGASVAFYYQHPEYLASRSRELDLSNRMKERLALTAAALVARNHYSGAAPWTAQAMAKELSLPSTTVEQVLAVLEAGGYLIPTAGTPPAYLVARAPESIPLADLLTHVRCYEHGHRGCREHAALAQVEEMERRFADAVAEALAGRTLRDLGDVPEAPAAAAEPTNAESDGRSGVCDEAMENRQAGTTGA